MISSEFLSSASLLTLLLIWLLKYDSITLLQLYVFQSCCAQLSIKPYSIIYKPIYERVCFVWLSIFHAQWISSCELPQNIRPRVYMEHFNNSSCSVWSPCTVCVFVCVPVWILPHAVKSKLQSVGWYEGFTFLKSQIEISVIIITGRRYANLFI